MKKLLLGLPLLLAPVFAHASAPTKLPAKIANYVRKLPEVKAVKLKGINAKDTHTTFESGTAGTFTINAFHPNRFKRDGGIQNLPPTEYTISGNFAEGSEGLQISSPVNVSRNQIQPLAQEKK
jgi:hypothetical protein